MHMNIRSLADMRKLDIIKIQLKGSGAHLIGLWERWLREDIPSNMLNIDGYNISRLDRAIKTDKGVGKRGGGVAVYCREDIKFSDHNFKDFNMSNANIEMQWISLHMDNALNINVDKSK